MDYTKVPRSLIYRDRRSLEEFGVYDEGNIMFPLADAMLHMAIIRHSDSENRALWCMNTAFYICTMILLEKDPRWRISNYETIAIPSWNYCQLEFKSLTLSLVVLLLAFLKNPLRNAHPYGDKVRKDFLAWLKKSFMYDELEFKVTTGSHIRYIIPNSTFSPRYIDKEAVHDALAVESFNWVQFVNYFEERSVRDIVKAFGSTEEEKHNVVDLLRQASHGFYTAGYNDYPEKVDKLLDDIDDEISRKYNPEATHIESETGISEKDKNDVDLTAYETRIMELEAENERLSKENEELKEIKKIMDTPLDGIEADSKVGLTEILKLMENDGADFIKHNNKTIAAKALKMMTGRSESACKQIFSSPLSPTYSGHKNKISELNGYLQALGMKTLL